MAAIIQLKGGAITSDPRLDRIPFWDENNERFLIRASLTKAQLRKPRSYTWRVGTSLDQGNEGACVGFAWAHELAARPVKYPSTYDAARGIYKSAQFIDEWPGEQYSGTSVLAGAKVVQSLGHMTEYRWAKTADELAAAVGYEGPAVLGVNWWTGMFNPDAEGFIHPTGVVEGGHAILCYSVSVRLRLFRLWNSWGAPSELLVSWDDMEQLLAEFGEACIPMQRKKVAA